MTDPHGAHGGADAGSALFTDAEWQEFQKSDIQSGGAVVVLMASIFGIGLILYSVVLYFVTASLASRA